GGRGGGAAGRAPSGGGSGGRWKPPVAPRFRMKAPRKIVPRAGPSLADAASGFFESHQLVRAFLQRFGDLDLVGVRFPNPFISGLRFSLATGLHVLEAHERRHLWQARRVAAGVTGAVDSAAGRSTMS